jgi:hypothetical protein
MILFGGAAATAQQPDLQQQVQELKRQYVETTRALEQRIAALEQQIEKEKETKERNKEGSVSAVELAAQEAVHESVLGQSN